MKGQLAVLPSSGKSCSSLRESLQYLLECEKMLEQIPACSANPESLHTCLAETHWRLTDLDSARRSCQRALAILAHRDGAPNMYATIFVLWIFQSVALEQKSWADAKSAFKCGQQLVERLEGS